ncbi:N-acetyl-gamma-glutamyl-phosphate reductase (EC [uncultured Gammaproteobacteria bacterium]|nr:N-acetyl-gamma-glutamyl-phosphate reductase (EC [uncultured Gammaproteobacteria bacterium]
MNKIKAGIIGGTGYTGVELLRFAQPPKGRSDCH